MAGIVDSAGEDEKRELLDARRRAFIEKLRNASPQDRREFMAEALSLGIPDTEVRHPVSKPPDKQEPVMDTVRRVRAKSKARLEEPL